jgi:hypothetical protein
MSLENSRKLIRDIAATREAEDYIEGLLKDPDMRADMERVTSKWDSLMKDTDTIAPEPPHPSRETEIER